jgi:Uma2 family endonuclease
VQTLAESTTTVAPHPRRFTVYEYYKMGEAGIFGEYDRVELLDGTVWVQWLFEQKEEVEPYPKRFTVEEFYRMGEAGVFGEGERVELIEGRVWEMTPIGLRHASCVDRLTRFLDRGVGEAAIVRVQSPVQIDEGAAVQPDLGLLKPKANFYADAFPTPKEILLVVEVADTSIRHDRTVKLPLYARAGVPEVWIVNLNKNVIEVYRNPSPEGYHDVQEFSGDQQLAPQAFPGLVLEMGKLFPQKG